MLMNMCIYNCAVSGVKVLEKVYTNKLTKCTAVSVMLTCKLSLLC